MGEETTRLREEIEQTRSDLTRDVDRLAEKTTPRRIVRRRLDRTRGRLVGLKERIMGSPDSYDDSGPASGAGSRMDSARESVTGATAHAADSARETVSSARDQLSQAGDRVQETAHEAVAGVRQQTEGNPLAAGLVAFGVGWLVSSLLPASDAETQAAQRAGDVARERGGPVLEQAKQSAQTVGEELKGQAQEAASHVKESAQEAAGAVREEARSSVPG